MGVPPIDIILDINQINQNNQINVINEFINEINNEINNLDDAGIPPLSRIVQQGGPDKTTYLGGSFWHHDLYNKTYKIINKKDNAGIPLSRKSLSRKARKVSKARKSSKSSKSRKAKARKPESKKKTSNVKKKISK